MLTVVVATFVDLPRRAGVAQRGGLTKDDLVERVGPEVLSHRVRDHVA